MAENKNGSITHIEEAEVIPSADKFNNVSDIGDKVIEISESIFCPNCGKKYYKPTSVYCCYCGRKRI